MIDEDIAGGYPMPVLSKRELLVKLEEARNELRRSKRELGVLTELLKDEPHAPFRPRSHR